MAKIGKKSLSVVLSLIMMLSVFSIVDYSLFDIKADAAGYVSTTVLTTRKDSVAGSSDWVQVAYPSDIYLPIGANLSETGASMTFTGHYGNNTNYRFLGMSDNWGGQTWNTSANWGFAASWKGSYAPSNGDRDLFDNFNNYGMYTTVGYHGTPDSHTHWYDANNWDSQMCYTTENPDDLNMTLYFTGSPKTTGDFNYNSAGSSLLWIYQQRSGSSGTWGGSGQYTGTYNGNVSFTIHVYDKTALNTAINNLPAHDAAYYSPDSWNNYQTALASANTAAAKQDITQTEVDAETTALTSAFNSLAENKASVKYVNSLGNGYYYTFSYPEKIYMDLSENIRDTGAVFSLTYETETGSRYLIIPETVWGGTYLTDGVSNRTLVNAFDNFDAAIQGFGATPVYVNAFYNGRTYRNIMGWHSERSSAHGGAYTIQVSGTPKATGTFTYTASSSTDLVSGISSSSEFPATGDLCAFNSLNTGMSIDGINITYIVYDKSELRNAINSLNASDYTESSWAAIQSVLASAQEVNNTRAVSQAEIDAAADALNAAIETLIPAGYSLYNTPQWDGSGTQWVRFGSESGDYLKSTYPASIYMDVAESLEDAGYYVQLNGHYGDSNNFSIMVHDYLWGGPTCTSNCQLSNSFNNYSFNGTVNGVKGVNSDDGQSNGVYNSNNVYWKRNTQTLNEKIYLIGTPKGTTTGTNYTTSGEGGGTQIVRFRQFENGSWVDKTVYTKDTGCSGGSATNPSSINNYWREMTMSVVIYDKAALNTEVKNDTANVSSNSSYLAYLTAGNWANYTSALNSANTVLSTRQTTQSSIDTQKSTLNSAATAIYFGASATALNSSVSTAEAIVAQTGYSVYYSEASRTALETAIANAKNISSLTGTYQAYNDAEAGAKAQANQEAIDALKTALDAAINGMSLVAPDFSVYTAFTAANLPLEKGTCYSAATLGAFNSAVAAVTALQADTSLTKRDDQADVDTAIANVQTKFNALVVEHSFGAWTSNDDGTHTKTCSACSETETADCTYTDVTVPATCYAKGYTVHTCSVCGYSYTDSYTEMIGHTWDSGVVTTEPTCTVSGTKTFTCTVAGCTATRTETIDALGHDYVSVVTAPTCTAKGYTTHTCSRCHDSYVDSETEMIAHSWDSGVITTEPTCTEDGEKTFTCSVCHATTTETVGALGHDYVQTVIAPTCKAQGYTEHTCSRCGDSYKTNYTAATGHSWDDGVITNAPTCTEDGIKTYTCTKCSETRTEVLTATGHDYKAEVTAPTCTQQGYTTYTCENCGDSYIDDYTDPTGHSWNSGEVTTPATCTTDGEKTFTCTACGETRTEVIPAAHQWGEIHVEKEATCTETGLMESTCSVCGLHQDQTVIPALGHVEVETKAAKAATCTEDGWTREVKCSRCNEILEASTAILATGHSYVDVVVNPTCTVAGYTVHTCSLCGDSYTSDTVPATGHSPFIYKAAKAATCTEDGWTAETRCANCGEVLEASTTIAATGHDYTSVVTPATCTQEGYTTHTCSNCDTSYVSNHIAALGHNWDAGTVTKPATCTVNGTKTYECLTCGETKTEIITAPGHSWNTGVIIKQSSCTEAGEIEYTCTVCGEKRTENLPLLSHSYTSVVTAPTCTEDGFTTYTCSICGDTYKGNTVAALGHDYKAQTIAPTCTLEGYTLYTCTICGNSYKEDYTPAAGHSYTSSVTAPTCTENGYTVYTCSVCGDSYIDDETPATGHSYQDTVVPPTCTEVGYTVHTCANCGDSYTDTEVPAVGHNFFEAERVEPTETQNGYIKYVCTLCGEEYSEILYKGNKALIRETLYDAQGKPVAEADVVMTNTETGEVITFKTDLNGYFTYVLPEGSYELKIHKDGFIDSTGYIYVENGQAQVELPTMATHHCDCLCHQTNVWAKLFKVLARLLKLFGKEVHCCDDCELWN